MTFGYTFNHPKSKRNIVSLKTKKHCFQKEFGNYIHEIKADLGMKANQNFTYQELLELAEEYKKMTE